MPGSSTNPAISVGAVVTRRLTRNGSSDSEHLIDGGTEIAGMCPEIVLQLGVCRKEMDHNTKRGRHGTKVARRPVAQNRHDIGIRKRHSIHGGPEQFGGGVSSER